MNIYEFAAYDMDGNLVSFEQYKGKVLLIFNSSVSCYLSDYYKEIERVYRENKHLGFLALDFPSDSFTDLSDKTIRDIDSEVTFNYHTTFPRFNKVELTGMRKDPLFLYLELETKFSGFDQNNRFTPVLEKIVSRDDPFYKKSSSIKWNFTFFLIGKDGSIVKRFEPTTDFKKIERAIKKALFKL